MKKILLSVAIIATSFTTMAQVGVGTTDPSAALDVVSTAGNSLEVTTGSNGSAIINANGSVYLKRALGATPDVNPDATILLSLGNSDKAGDPRVLDFSVSDINVATIRAVATKINFTGGNVGIGVADPLMSFHVAGLARFDTSVQFGDVNAADGTGIAFVNSDNNTWTIDNFGPGAGDSSFRIISTGGTTGATVPFRAAESGNVGLGGNIGIGTDVISSRISIPVAGTDFIGKTAATAHDAGNVGAITLGVNDGGNQAGVTVSNTHDGTFSSSEILFTTGQGGVSFATERMKIRNNGAVSIGTGRDASGRALSVNGHIEAFSAGDNPRIYLNSNDATTFSDVAIDNNSGNFRIYREGGPEGTRVYVSIDSEGSLTIPGYFKVGNEISGAGTTGTAGMIRFNSASGKFEGHDGSGWVLLN